MTVSFLLAFLSFFHIDSYCLTMNRQPSVLGVACRLAAALVLFVLQACSQPSAEETRFRKILIVQSTRYPRWEVQDLYKFVHQAAMGSGHAVSDTDMARAWLTREMASLEDLASPEPIIDTLSPDGLLARIHLRPFLKAGGSPDTLLTAFVQTANEFRGDPETLRRYWALAEKMAERRDLSFPPDELAAFFTEMESQGFPAVHHSEVYRNTYLPAYRVVIPELLFPD
ncbi:MAG: hypothetical protein JSW54_12120 [Fidelibacterota bacterium]|nr:MAG: hypothetical protein JSW54_12120 [Candidatus Neomarinimicrobiota bacterium]